MKSPGIFFLLVAAAVIGISAAVQLSAQVQTPDQPECIHFCYCNGAQCLTHPPNSLYCNQCTGDTAHPNDPAKCTDLCKWWDGSQWNYNSSCSDFCCLHLICQAAPQPR